MRGIAIEMITEGIEKRPVKTAIIIAVLVAIVWLGLGYYASNQKDPGTFGDMFGGVNALFSGLAFAGLIYAILLQRVELRLQRTELEATRRELEGQKEQMAAQVKTLKQQVFDNTFFQLLRLHNDIVNAIDLVGDSTRITKGRDCFAVFYKRLRKQYENVCNDEKNKHLSDRVRVQEAYQAFYEENQAEIGHYFRSLYNIIKLVKNSDLEDRRLYTNLVRAQLSSYELLLLFYNCLSELGREKLTPLSKEFDLFKHLRAKMLIDPTHASLY